MGDPGVQKRSPQLGVHGGDYKVKGNRLLGPKMGETLVFLARMSFSSATDLAILRNEAIRTTAGRLGRLLKLRMVDCCRHGTTSQSWQNRYWVTTRGLRTAVQQGFISEAEANRSAAITQSLSGRVDAAAAINRVATDLLLDSDTDGEIIHAPVRHPYDALIRVGPSWAALFRQSHTQSRASLRERIDRHVGDPKFALILTPTIVDRIAIGDHLARNGKIGACMSTEGVVGSVPDGATSWFRPGGDHIMDQRIPGLFNVCNPQIPYVRGRASPLRSISRGFQHRTDVTRLLNSLVEWPLIRSNDLMNILGTDRRTLSGTISRAGALVESRRRFLRRDGDDVRLCLSSEGIDHVAGRDLVKASDLHSKLSVEYDRNYSTPYRGSRIRQWVRQSLHDDYAAATTGHIIRLLKPEWTICQVTPPPRSAMFVRPGSSYRAGAAPRYIDEWRQHTSARPPRRLTEKTVVAFRPDVMVIVERRLAHPLLLLLEIERTARTLSELERRLETYLIFSLLRPDHDRARFLPLWVFDDLTQEAGAWILIREWCRRTGRKPFIATSTVERIDRLGIHTRVWRVLEQDMTLLKAVDNVDPPLNMWGR